MGRPNSAEIQACGWCFVWAASMLCAREAIKHVFLLALKWNDHRVLWLVLGQTITPWRNPLPSLSQPLILGIEHDPSERELTHVTPYVVVLDLVPRVKDYSEHLVLGTP